MSGPPAQIHEINGIPVPHRFALPISLLSQVPLLSSAALRYHFEDLAMERIHEGNAAHACSGLHVFHTQPAKIAVEGGHPLPGGARQFGQQCVSEVHVARCHGA